jgi:hypothetical protein
MCGESTTNRLKKFCNSTMDKGVTDFVRCVLTTIFRRTCTGHFRIRHNSIKRAFSVCAHTPTHHSTPCPALITIASSRLTGHPRNPHGNFLRRISVLIGCFLVVFAYTCSVWSSSRFVRQFSLCPSPTYLFAKKNHVPRYSKNFRSTVTSASFD